MRQKIEKIFNEFTSYIQQYNLEFLLEADVIGWLFYTFVIDGNFQNAKFHLDTRVNNYEGRCDIAYGDLIIKEKPLVDPIFLIEVKLFPCTGFSSQQKRRRFLQIIEKDLVKLKKMCESLPCFMFIMDGCGYLKGKYKTNIRVDTIINIRNEIAHQIDVFVMSFDKGIWTLNKYD